MSVLELKIPPVLVFAISVALMWLSSRYTPGAGFSDKLRIVLGIVSTVTGLSIAVAGLIGFKRVKTSIDPVKPDEASSLVRTGIYQYSRNPMYLGLICALFTWACYLDNLFALVFIVTFSLYMTRFQIKPEERILEAKFGRDYRIYKDQVRRWL